MSLRSLVYLPVGAKGGGLVESDGMSLRGSPLMFWVIRNWLGSSVSTGRTLSATGLYFLPAYMAIGVQTFRNLIGGISFIVLKLEKKMESICGELRSHRERYAATKSFFRVSSGSGAQASIERESELEL